MVRWYFEAAAFNGLKCFIFFVCLSFGYAHPDIYKVRPGGSRDIQPYTCHDPATKEEGVCMFSWNCQRSNGTHLTYCMDRFYFGSCCKLPPGVYVATPSSIDSNDVTEVQSFKQKPTQLQTQKHSSYTTESSERQSTSRIPSKPVKASSTEFPPGLVTWRPHASPSTTVKPIKVKPTKLFSTKPLFASTVDDQKVDNRIKNETAHTSAKEASSSTSIPKRRTRPTRPSGSTSKRRTRPTRPLLSSSTTATITRRKTRPTRPHTTSTTPLPVSSTRRSTIGTWSNILEGSTRPLPITKRTTIRTSISYPKTTPTVEYSTRNISRPLLVTVLKTKPTKPSTVTTPRTKPSKPSTVTTLRVKPTKPSTVSTLRAKPTRPTPPIKVKPTKPSTSQTDSLPSTRYSSRKPIESTYYESTIEIVTFPPFPGMTKTTKTTQSTTTTTPKPRRTSLRPKPTTPPPTRPSTTTSTLPPTDQSTTPKIVPGLEYTKVCGRPKPGPVGRIVGGGNSYFGEWPWVVSLRQWKKNAFLHKCGATLLNEFWAITAAHCVENVPLTDILLRLGEYDISHENEPLPFVERRVQIVASHPQFDRRTFEYDLALLRFYEPVTFQRNILPICVPAGNNTYVGKYATVTGWGRLYEDGPLPDVIQEVSLPVITNKLCESMYRQAGFVEDIPDIFICAGYADGGKDSCEGDSGGPMVLQEDDGRWVLAGVISWGIGCALPNQPGVYTRITKFSEWINQIIIF